MKNIFLFGIILFSLVVARKGCLIHAEKDALGRTMRPETDTLAISSSGHFYIHFDTTGFKAPDLTDNNDNGIPDYVDEVGMIADSARYLLVDVMGFEGEPFDGLGGYDIYLENLGDGEYGWSVSEGNGNSYMRIDNDYMEFTSVFNLSPIKIMQISLGHEYFHSIQWGYEHNLSNNAYFYEMTSMWFEDVLVPDGNDYLDDWVDPFLNAPTATFDQPPDNRGYCLALFGHYLSSFIDSKGIDTAKNSTIIREIWERYGNTNSNAFYATKYVLENNYDISFIEAWTDFMSRNLYNGIYKDMDNPFYYYIDQSILDPILTFPTELSDSAEFVLELDDKSAAIESFEIGNMESLITIEHDPEVFTGRVAIVSSDKPELNNLFWGIDTTLEESFNDADVHFVYGIDGSSIILPIEIAVHTVPMPPENLMAVVAQDSIILSWNPSPGPGVNLSYVIFRDNDSIAVVHNDTTHVDKQNIDEGQSYTYKVTCQNAIGASSASKTISVISWPDEKNVLNSKIIKIYPNPIRQSKELTILYALDSDYSKPIINLINVRGEVVNSIKLSSFSQGWHRENINSILNNNPSNGIYFLRLQPDLSPRQTKKITIIN